MPDKKLDPKDPNADYQGGPVPEPVMQPKGGARAKTVPEPAKPVPAAGVPGIPGLDRMPEGG